LSGKFIGKLASVRRVLQQMSRMRWVLAVTGIAVLLCLTWAGCGGGFFIKPSISSMFITPPSATVAVTNTVQLTASATYSDGSQNTLSGSTVGWSSSDDTVATISSPGGLVTGVATGTATITATAQGVSATGTITVTPSNVNSIQITTTQGSTQPQSTATIAGSPGVTKQFYAYANMSSSQDLTQAVTWSSSNTSVATISSGASGGGNGLASSVAPGTTNITATITNTTSGTVVTSNTIVLTVQ
jgi:trimeric autotransporter adhesin